MCRKRSASEEEHTRRIKTELLHQASKFHLYVRKHAHMPVCVCVCVCVCFSCECLDQCRWKEH